MQRENEVQHVFLVGAKSLGAYGGYETFVYKLTEYHQNKKNIKYHVACKANGDGCMDETKVDGVTRINNHEFEFHNAHCFKIDIPQIGPAQAIYYDVAALKACCKYIKEHHIKHPIVYIMACRIGPFAGHFYKEIHKLGGTVYLNPDGHEWMRAKWSAPIRKYWKISEQMMVKYCDLAICDSVNIEKYIHECYDGKGIKGRNPKTTFIAYGADLTLSKLSDDDEKLVNWYKEKGLTKKDYYLVVGRFVPENSFEVMIREFMKSKSKKDFAIITNVNEKFLNELEEKLHFKSDKRIKFVGTVYDQELLKKIRENAYAYFHGHTVGGTNPSLIEALGSTDLNLLVDVGFNKEVAEDCALYWSRKPGSLAKLIDKADQMSTDEIAEMGRRAKKRVAEEYTWDKICGQYEDVFLKYKKLSKAGMMIEYYAVVVLYNKKIQESITISHLMQLKEEQLHIIVLDNSTDDYVVENKEYFPIDLLTYHSMGGNVGLSKAYNYALSILKDKSEDDIVIWFDDDTPVKQEYFDCLKNKVVDKTFDVFVPVIYGQNGVIYSPNESGWLKGKYIKSPEQQIPQNKFNAINSCLAVRLKAYKGYTYDEGLFMDCVDTKLFDDFRKKELKFCTLPVKIYQNFFLRSDSRNVQKYWNRFCIRINDTLYYSSLNGFSSKLCGYIRILGWSLVYGIKLRSIKFSLLCIEQMLNHGGEK